MTDALQPLPFDPSRVTVQSMIDLHAGEPWLLTSGGDYDTFAVYVLKRDGTDGQTLIALQWPTRINHTDTEQIVQLLIHPDDVRGLVDVLTHTCDWLDEAKRMSG
jgi:hypothetical protein